MSEHSTLKKKKWKRAQCAIQCKSSHRASFAAGVTSLLDSIVHPFSPFFRVRTRSFGILLMASFPRTDSRSRTSRSVFSFSGVDAHQSPIPLHLLADHAQNSTDIILGEAPGMYLLQKRNRLFSLIIGGLNCLQIPFGTALGVLTMLVLSRDSVRQLYSGAAEST